MSKTKVLKNLITTTTEHRNPKVFSKTIRVSAFETWAKSLAVKTT